MEGQSLVIRDTVMYLRIAEHKQPTGGPQWSLHVGKEKLKGSIAQDRWKDQPNSSWVGNEFTIKDFENAAMGYWC